MKHRIYFKEQPMNNDENENYNQEENNKPDFDPAGETKQKLIFFVVAIILVVGVKFLMGL